MGESNKQQQQQQEQSHARDVAMAYVYMALWISLSAGVILINKYILDPKMGNFPFPLTLTAFHMLFGTILSWSCVTAGLVAPVQMPWDTYIKSIVPVGFLFAGVLWGSNAVYIHLSVSFIQMLKATMPIFVYVVACGFGTEKPEVRTLLNMMVVVAGILLASWAEVVFVVIGVVLQISCNVAEACRLSLVQILLQKKGIKLNPVQTLCYIAPACLAFMIVPCIFLEGPRVLAHEGAKAGLFELLVSATMAFALNCAVFLLVGKTSALTMNIAGIVKDLLLIMASMGLYKSVVTPLQWVGYLVALAGVSYYNYHKIIAAKPPTTVISSNAKLDAHSQKDQMRMSNTDDEEKQMLLKAGREN